jgi:hypothetical protein
VVHDEVQLSMDCRIKSIKSTNDEDGASFRDKRVDCLVREIRDGHSSSQTVPGFQRACHRAGHFGPDPLVQSGLRLRAYYPSDVVAGLVRIVTALPTATMTISVAEC